MMTLEPFLRSGPKMESLFVTQFHIIISCLQDLQKNTFLIRIGAEICEKKDKEGKHVLADVQDKVVQDITGEEGTGVWSNEQAVTLHVPAPSLSAAHFLRIASAFRGEREHARKTFQQAFPLSEIKLRGKERDAFIEDLRLAVYCSCLTAYVQGFNIIAAADKENKWGIDYAAIVQIWKAGCIIQADHISGLLEKIFHPNEASEHKDRSHNLLYEPSIVNELKEGFENLKNIVMKAVEINALVPSMSATLEYLKYCGGYPQLPETMHWLILRKETWSCPLSFTKQSWTISGSICMILRL